MLNLINVIWYEPGIEFIYGGGFATGNNEDRGREGVEKIMGGD